MKIAITATRGDLNSDVYQQFGRTPWLIFLDTKDGREVAVANTWNLGTDQDFGIQTARKVVQLGAQAMVTGYCGPRAFEILKAAHVFVYSGIEGMAVDAARWLEEGYLVPSGTPNKLNNWTETCEQPSGAR